MITISDKQLPDLVSHNILTFLNCKDLVNCDRVWPIAGNRLWMKLLQRNMKNDRNWIKICKYFEKSEWLNYEFSINDSKEICMIINQCHENIQENWKKGVHLTKEIFLEKNYGNMKKEFNFEVEIDCLRIVIWQAFQRKILIFKRFNFEKEDEIDTHLNVSFVSLKNDLLFVSLPNGLVKVWNLGKPKENPLELNHPGKVGFTNYFHDILISLSQTPLDCGDETVLIVRDFADPNNIQTNQCLIPFECNFAVAFDGHFIYLYRICVVGDDDGCPNGCYILSVDGLQLMRYIPNPDPEVELLVTHKVSQGLLIIVYTNYFCVYEVKTGNLLRKVGQKAINTDNSICINSEYLVTASQSGTESNKIFEIKIWKLFDLCQESIPESECLVFSIIPPTLNHANFSVLCDSFQIIVYYYENGARFLIYDFSGQMNEKTKVYYELLQDRI